jgi:predicted membrane channel-forming protein YqfA (hemolysin III family)
MPNEKTGFFEEAPCVRSSTRLIFILGSLAVLAMAGTMVWRGTATPFDIGTFICMAMAAIGGTKVAGAWQEKKNGGEPK